MKPSYYAAGYNIMVPKSMNLKSWAELKGKPVCGIKGAYYNKEAAENFELQVAAFTGTAEALTALKQGRCVGLLYDDTSIEGDLLQPEWSDYDMPLESQDAQPWGLAVRKDQPEWAAYMSTMVKKWEKDGTIVNLETQVPYQAFEVRGDGTPEGVHVIRLLVLWSRCFDAVGESVSAIGQSVIASGAKQSPGGCACPSRDIASLRSQ